MSLFIAIDLPESIKNKISLTQKKLSNINGLRLISSKNLHLTLVFLGEEESERIVSQLKGIQVPKLNIDIEGFGFFPDANNPRVVWLRVINNSTLKNLQKDISNKLNKERDYNPHITLGRINNLTKEEFIQIIEVLKEFNPQKFETNNMYLYESTTTNLGTIYNVIEKF